MHFTSSNNWDILTGIASVFVIVAVTVWILWRSLKRSEDPPRLIFKWVLTAVVGGYLVFSVVPDVARGGEGSIVGIMITLVVGLVLAIIWRHNIVMMIAKPFASLYDGGNEETDAKPVYSTAMMKRSRGDYHGARLDIHHQLQRFPTDVQGQMLLAEIEAQDFKDLRAAEIVVERFVNQPDHAPANIAYALNSMADWHLKFAQDRDAARASIERIIEKLPDSEWALRAAQRVAHLGNTELLMGRDNRRTFKVTHIEGDPGLEARPGAFSHVEADPAEMATGYVEHLIMFPHDTDAREKLAQLYARHYRRLDLAQDQMEQLIQHPNQPAKQVVRWLHLLADWQVEHGVSCDNVRATLQRIIDLHPDAASAITTQKRIELLPLEFKGKEKSQAVKLGSYEDDLGLKGSAHKL